MYQTQTILAERQDSALPSPPWARYASASSVLWPILVQLQAKSTEDPWLCGIESTRYYNPWAHPLLLLRLPSWVYPGSPWYPSLFLGLLALQLWCCNMTANRLWVLQRIAWKCMEMIRLEFKDSAVSHRVEHYNRTSQMKPSQTGRRQWVKGRGRWGINETWSNRHHQRMASGKDRALLAGCLEQGKCHGENGRCREEMSRHGLACSSEEHLGGTIREP